VKVASHERLLVISPHLDDAVFSCGALLAMHRGANIATVFAGIPPPPRAQLLTEWDKLSGFHSGEEAVIMRRREDIKALQELSAHPIWLDFLDSQYGVTTSVAELKTALEELVVRLDPRRIFIPAGLFHSDHLLVHRALISLCRRSPERSWWMYEEAMYRRIPGLLSSRLDELHAMRMHVRPMKLAESMAMIMKRGVVNCYASQLRALKYKSAEYGDIFSYEQYWHLGQARNETAT
jgi:LmbE family N-acetylglucosaminyl deacetylase